LTEALERVVAPDDSPPLVIEADAQTPHQSVMRALDAARRAGLVRVAFAAVPERATGAVAVPAAPTEGRSDPGGESP
jgi:biopolymer transport protein ExbD